MPRIDRRRFLLTMAAAAPASGLLLTGCGTGVTPLEQRFLDHYDYLTIDLEGLRRFLTDYRDAYGELTEDDLPFLKFLASSDFFLNGKDENRPVRYLMLRDPYRNPCFYPFRTR